MACRRLADTLPGSVLTLVNYDLPRQAINASFAPDLDPAFLASYRDHYASVNPWLDFWATIAPGQILSSERVMPSSSFRDSEFYVDWLAPQGDMEAAVGLRLDVDPHNMVHVAWHFGLAQSETYERPALAMLERLRSRIGDAVRDAQALRSGIENGLRLGPIMDRIDGAAFLVERDRRVREANAEASLLLGRSDIASMASNVLVLRDAAANRWLEETVMRLIDDQPVDSTTLIYPMAERLCRLTLTSTPEHSDVGTALLVPPRPQVLVILKLLVGGMDRLDDIGLRAAFGLSPAEVRLCEILINGNSLAAAARQLGLSDGTVRQRVKLIFHKTGTHRQGELIALLGRFRNVGDLPW